MAEYLVVITVSVQKYISKLPGNIADKIEGALLLLENNPRSHGCKK